MNDVRRRTLLRPYLLAAGLLGAPAMFGTQFLFTQSAWGQAAPSAPAAAGTGTQATNAGRLLGTVTSTSEDTLTLKLESGGEAIIAVQPQTRIVRTAPGEKTLTGATAIHLTDLTAGDRVLVRTTPGADATHYNATVVIAMKQADIAQAHASQAEDWQKRGVSGVVKSVNTDNAAGGAATLVVSTAQPGHMLTIHLTPATIIRRYAAGSVNFADARPATLADIHAGDQLRARGDKNEDSTEVTAVEVVAGSFRNVAGTIISIDTATSTLTVTDLATKKPVTLHLTADTQMRQLPPQMAQALARRLNPGAAGSGSSEGAGRPAGGGRGVAAGAGSGVTPGPRPSADARPAPDAPADQAGSQPGGDSRAHGDPASMLQRAPLVTLAALKKGDAVMVVATESGGSAADAATAITLISGVEPLLQGSSSASQSLFSASWNMGGGGAEAGTQ